MSIQENRIEGGNIHVAVYQVLDGVLSGTTITPGARGTIFSVVDNLRSTAANSDERCMAEQISLEIFKLESALQCADLAAAQAARIELKLLAVNWLERRIGNAN